MPTYNEGDEKNYFPMMLAALVVVALAIATFIFNLVSPGPGDLDDDIIIEENGGFTKVSPGAGLAQPTSPPEDIMAPTTAPEFN